MPYFLICQKAAVIVKSPAAILALAVVATWLMASPVRAEHFAVLDSSTLGDIRHIGGDSIIDLGQYQGFGGELDITNPANWSPVAPEEKPLPEEPASLWIGIANISGSLEITDQHIGAATLSLLGQPETTIPETGGRQDDLIEDTIDAALFASGEDVASRDLAVRQESLTWIYDTGAAVMLQQDTSGRGCTTAEDREGATNCDPGKEAAGPAAWNWDGLAAGWAISSGQSAAAGSPDSCADDSCQTEQIVIAQEDGTPGVSWDLSNLNKCLEHDECTISARVVSSEVAGAAGQGAMSALYTLHLKRERPRIAWDDFLASDTQAVLGYNLLLTHRDDQHLALDPRHWNRPGEGPGGPLHPSVPLPATLWLLGSGLGLLGFIRRHRNRCDPPLHTRESSQ